MGIPSTWLSRVGRTLQSMGKMEDTLGKREMEGTGQRSRIGLEERRVVDPERGFSKTNSDIFKYSYLSILAIH